MTEIKKDERDEVKMMAVENIARNMYVVEKKKENNGEEI